MLACTSLNHAALNIFADNYLQQLTDKPTRSNYVLDLIATMYPENIACLNTFPGISEAVIASFKIEPLRVRPQPRSTRLYKKADVEALRKEIQD